MINWRWNEVDILESQERWNEAKLIMIKKWNENPVNVKAAIRLGFLCWYILVEEDCIGGRKLGSNELESILNEVTHFGLTNFMENEDFLWCFGYMISQFPYYFGDYEYWEEKGISMLKRAYELCPDDPVYQYSYLGSLPDSGGKLKVELQQVQTVLEDRFQGEGILSDYFKDVWRN